MELSSGGGGAEMATVGAVAMNGGGSPAAGGVRDAVHDLFNLYLARPPDSKSALNQRDTFARLRNPMVSLSIRQLPKDEQFAHDFLQLRNHFPDSEQLRAAAESVLAILLVQCSRHSLQVEFLLYSLQALLRLAALQWDSFIPMLLNAVASLESLGSGRLDGRTPEDHQALQGNAGHNASVGNSAVVPSASGTSASGSTIASPAHSAVDASANFFQSSATAVGSPMSPGNKAGQGAKMLSSVGPLICKILPAALESDLKPAVAYEIVVLLVSWLNQWDSRASQGSGEQSLNQEEGRIESVAWLHACVELIWALVNESKCRVPFYALLHDRTQLLVDRVPDNEALFALFLEVHRKRDKIALYMLMLDHHLHCPTFATMRMSAFTYPGTLGEQLHGEDIASAVPRGSLDWERAMRCLGHALRSHPSADWWRRVLLYAPKYRQQTTPQQTTVPRPGSQPGPEFTSEMLCEALVEHFVELMKPSPPASGGALSPTTEGARWQEWLTTADVFYFFMRSGYIDFLAFIDKLTAEFARGEQPVIRSNHVTWLLAQVFRLETVTEALSNDSRKLETAQKILSFYMAERPVDQSGSISPQTMLLDFVGSSLTLRLWSINRQMMEQITGNRMSEHIQKGKQIDEWWKQVGTRERVLDYSSLDDKSMGMVWVLSHTVSQPICEAIMTWMNQKGVNEVMSSSGPTPERLSVVLECRPLPILLLSGLSLHMCFRLINTMEELILPGKLVPSIGMVETYVRLLLVAPQTLFRHHAHGMIQKFQNGLARPGVALLLLEVINYRLLPFFRYQGKIKQLIFDIAKILITVKNKRGEHRLFRLAENLGLNLILSLREVILIKKELKGATTEFTETLNRAMVINLAFTMKTRGIPEMEQLIVLHPALDQILASSNHVWSEKTMRHFPPSLRDAISARENKRGQVISQWQQAEATVLHHCRQLLSPTHDPSYILTALSAMNHNFPQNRQYLCAGVWMLMERHIDDKSFVNLGRILKELAPEEVTTNIYIMVDVLLHDLQVKLQHGHAQKNLLLKASSDLAVLMWTHEVIPFDITLLALADRDDDPHALRLVVGLLLDRPEFLTRVQHYFASPASQDHWAHPGPFQRFEPQQALGQHLAGKDRYPIFFDEMCLRAIPVIPLILYRLIENDATTETAEHLLVKYQNLLKHHPAHFTFVRDTLAYFYGSLPSKLVVRLLGSLDLSKIPFSDAFLQHVGSLNSMNTLSADYYSNLLNGLVTKVIPPLRNARQKTSSAEAEMMPTSSRANAARAQTVPQANTNATQSTRAFYQHQDPGTYTQLVLETAVVELLSLPPPPNQVVTMLVNVAVTIPSPPHLSAGHSGNPRSPLSSGSSDASSIGHQTGLVGSCPLIIQACGLLLAQLPTAFHGAFYAETARIIKESWWVIDQKAMSRDLDSVFNHVIWDPTWAVQDEISNILGNTLALLHSFCANLPYDWLEGVHAVITLQRPITSVVHLRVAFRIIGPLLARFVMYRQLFAKTLALLFTIMADVFGRNTTLPQSFDPSEISDLVDFLHHAVMMEGQGQSNQNGRLRPETLLLCTRAVERLHPQLQHLFRHLSNDVNVSMYAATHPKMTQRPPSFGVM